MKFKIELCNDNHSFSGFIEGSSSSFFKLLSYIWHAFIMMRRNEYLKRIADSCTHIKSFRNVIRKRNFRANDSISVKLFFALNFFNYLFEVCQAFHFPSPRLVFGERRSIHEFSVYCLRATRCTDLCFRRLMQ